jgi:hypothetical protein
MVQVPAVRIVTVIDTVPDPVQTLVVAEARLTVRPDVAVALTVTVCELVPLYVCVAGAPPKLIVWAIKVVTLKDTVAVPAAAALVGAVPSVAVTTTVQFAKAGAVPTVRCPVDESTKPSAMLAESRRYETVPVLPLATTNASCAADDVPFPVLAWGVVDGAGIFRATLIVKL